MIDYKTYRLLNEHLGQYNLGVKPVQTLGIASDRPGFAEVGLPPELSAKGKPPIPGEEEEEEIPGDLPPIPGEDEIPEDLDDEDVPDEDEEDPDAEDEDLDDEDDELNHEDDVDDEEDLDGEEMPPEDGPVVPGLPMKKPVVTAFMKKEARHHDPDVDTKKERSRGNPDKDYKRIEDEGGVQSDKSFDSKEKGTISKKTKGIKNADGSKRGSKQRPGEPVFMMKKKCGSGDNNNLLLGMKKKCDDGSCEKCKKHMKGDKVGIKKEGSDYARPKDYDPSEEAFFQSVREQLAQTRVNQKFDDGMTGFKAEDCLLSPPGAGLEGAKDTPPQPGEPGYAPQTRIGDFTAESIQDMMKRIERLERGPYRT